MLNEHLLCRYFISNSEPLDYHVHKARRASLVSKQVVK